MPKKLETALAEVATYCTTACTRVLTGRGTAIRAFFSTMARRADSVVTDALATVSGSRPAAIDTCDTFIMGDVHGRLDLFAQNLFVAGFLAKGPSGVVLTGKQATLISTGDFIDRGPHEIEAILLFKALQLYAEQTGKGTVVNLVGNHEFFRLLGRKFKSTYALDDSSQATDLELLTTFLTSEIKAAKLLLAYEPTNEAAKYIVTHAGVRKSVLQQYVLEQGLTLPVTTTKVTIEDLYGAMGSNPVTAFVNWLNTTLRTDTLGGLTPGHATRPLYRSGGKTSDELSGPLWTRHRGKLTVTKLTKYLTEPVKEYKPVQFVGHTPRREGITRKGNVILVDVGLQLFKRQAFVGLDDVAIQQIFNTKRADVTNLALTLADWRVAKIVTWHRDGWVEREYDLVNKVDDIQPLPVLTAPLKKGDRQWVPDKMVTRCQNCQTRFRITRKHHCRRCGGIFCDTCSSHRDTIGTTKVRVCNLCYHRAHPDDLGSKAHWVPDSLAKTCSGPGCTKALKRGSRHHCRKCGKVFCSTCSRYKVKFHRKFKLGTRSQRVCKACHDSAATWNT